MKAVRLSIHHGQIDEFFELIIRSIQLPIAAGKCLARFERHKFNLLGSPPVVGLRGTVLSLKCRFQPPLLLQSNPDDAPQSSCPSPVVQMTFRSKRFRACQVFAMEALVIPTRA
jgi:hypothetical protein